MDLRAVKAATTAELIACAVAAANNAQGLLDDAELLSEAGRIARAYSLAVLAVEEFGKAVNFVTLSAMPEKLRAQAPVRRMLEWHQLKQIGGLLMAVVPISNPGAATRLANMPLSQLTDILDRTHAFVQDSDRLKLRGLYVDMQRDARIRQPSEITEAEASDQIDRARQVASSARQIHDPAVRARLANPPVETIELSRALVSAFAEAGDLRKPEAAAKVALMAVRKLQEQLLASGMREQKTASGAAPGMTG
jgi:AbiV family abortive infection protein